MPFEHGVRVPIDGLRGFTHVSPAEEGWTAHGVAGGELQMYIVYRGQELPRDVREAIRCGRNVKMQFGVPFSYYRTPEYPIYMDLYSWRAPAETSVGTALLLGGVPGGL